MTRQLHRSWAASAAAIAIVALVALATGPAGGASAAAPRASGTPVARPACASAPAGHAACTALSLVDSGTGRPMTGAALERAGLRPFTAADLTDAYRLPSSTAGSQSTIAIVDAYDDPSAGSDLATYRAANGLPPCATSPCFRKLDQRGGTGMPRPDDGWAGEISLDLDMASAICPRCRLLLVEADTNGTADLGAAEDTAVRLGADVVSNSYDSIEFKGERAQASHYDHAGVAITASSGDYGFGASFPADLATVTAVGGTALYREAKHGWAEQSWAGAGSGCSAYIPKPSWQKDPLCGKRTIADVAAVADPNTPVSVYDTYDAPGWVAFGGTSVAAPIIAGVYALAGNTHRIGPDYPYAHRGGLVDITDGPANGTCGDSYLCQPRTGYDGPTGLGAPRGTSAF